MISFQWIYRFSFLLVRLFFLFPLVMLAKTLVPQGRGGKFLKTILLRWEGLDQLKEIPPRKPRQKVYWFHAASGEIEYAKPVIRALKQRDPQCFIVWSYSSNSALDFFAGMVDVDFKFPLPFDTAANARHLIEKVQPHLFLIARSDLWPELLHQMRLENIPRILFAATVSEQKARSPVNQNVFSLLSHISCVGKEDEKNLQSMGLSAPIFRHGDPRADQVFHRVKSASRDLDLARCLRHRKILLLGSSWPEDEEALRAVYTLSDWSYIVVPHDWAEEKRQHYLNLFSGLRVTFFSELEQNGFVNHPLHDVVVVDRKGLLAELYRDATAVFVGGSFREKVHSVYEPLAWGKKVFVGPYYQNNREAVEFSKSQGTEEPFVQVVAHGRELAEILQKRSSEDFLKWQIPITHAIESQLGASERIVELIFKTSLPR